MSCERGKADDVPGNEEEPGEPELGDHAQLVLEPATRLRVDPSRPVTRVHLTRTGHHQMSEVLILACERTRHGEVRELRGEQVEVERKRFTEISGTLDRAGEPGETPCHLLGASQVALIGGGAEAVGDVEVTTSADRRQHLGQVGVAAKRIVHVVAGDRGQPQPGGCLGEHLVTDVVLGHVVVPQLDVQPAGEQLSQPGSSRHGPRHIGPLSGTWHGTLPAPGERNEAAVACSLAQLLVLIDRAVLLPSILTSRDEPADCSVPGRVGSEQHEMIGRFLRHRFRPVHPSDATPTRSRLHSVSIPHPRSGV